MDLVKIVLIFIAAAASIACTVLLFRAYLASRTRILLWSGLCFVGQSINNLAAFTDLVLLPATDLRLLRLSASFIGLGFLLYGFIKETQ